MQIPWRQNLKIFLICLLLAAGLCLQSGSVHPILHFLNVSFKLNFKINSKWKIKREMMRSIQKSFLLKGPQSWRYESVSCQFVLLLLCLNTTMAEGEGKLTAASASWDAWCLFHEVGWGTDMLLLDMYKWFCIESFLHHLVTVSLWCLHLSCCICLAHLTAFSCRSNVRNGWLCTTLSALPQSFLQF